MPSRPLVYSLSKFKELFNCRSAIEILEEGGHMHSDPSKHQAPLTLSGSRSTAGHWSRFVTPTPHTAGDPATCSQEFPYLTFLGSHTSDYRKNDPQLSTISGRYGYIKSEFGSVERSR